MKNIEPYFYIPSWPVYYEDNHLLVVYKPSGLLIQGDRTEDVTLPDLAKQWIKRRYEKPGRVFLALVHRLDRPVAGVVVLARTSKAAGRLSEQFRSGVVQKQYVAVVEGVVQKPSGRLVNHLERRGPTSRVVTVPTKNSREAMLHFRVLSTRGNRSFIEIDLETGRHHQIRAQLAHMGYPIVGDLRYGAKAPMPERQLALFAQKLAFDHPTQKTQLTFVSPVPQGWPWPDAGKESDAPPWNWGQLQQDIADVKSP